MRGKLFRMVFLWTKDRDLAEDVLQNVFEKNSGASKGTPNTSQPSGLDGKKLEK
ncbi:hypothetical protein [Algoriphagus boritolerans]|uniref:hypothetical protein n=1 Tax=Algoriphagus boritolerans TaxID=308111 RepID=UPI002FCDEEF6